MRRAQKRWNIHPERNSSFKMIYMPSALKELCLSLVSWCCCAHFWILMACFMSGAASRTLVSLWWRNTHAFFPTTITLRESSSHISNSAMATLVRNTRLPFCICRTRLSMVAQPSKEYYTTAFIAKVEDLCACTLTWLTCQNATQPTSNLPTETAESTCLDISLSSRKFEEKGWNDWLLF